MSDSKICPKGHPMVKCADAFYYRGRSYIVDFCETCNSLWNCPPQDFWQDVEAGVFNDTRPGDRVLNPNIPLPTFEDKGKRAALNALEQP